MFIMQEKYWLYLASKFLIKFICYKFFNNFSYNNLKKLLKNFKTYTLKYPKIYTLQKFFLQLLQ